MKKFDNFNLPKLGQLVIHSPINLRESIPEVGRVVAHIFRYEASPTLELKLRHGNVLIVAPTDCWDFPKLD